MRHYTQLIFCRDRFHHVAWAGVKFLNTSSLPTLASQSAGTTGVSCRTQPECCFLNPRKIWGTNPPNLPIPSLYISAVWNAVDSGYCLQTYSLHTEAVRAARWSPCGRRILSGGFDFALHLTDLETGSGKKEMITCWSSPCYVCPAFRGRHSRKMQKM
ncbi:WD repeat-containing protein 25 [Plecturocebus cupreus]